jgi:dihydroxyacetone kinase-like predicted kinase
VEVIDMHAQIEARNKQHEHTACAVVAVVLGAGNRRLFESLGAIVVADAGEVSAAVERANAAEVIVLPAETIPAGLSALVAFDPSSTGQENLVAMRAAAAAVATGAVSEADGRWLGSAEGEPVGEGPLFEAVARPVIERLLAEPKSVLTLLTGERSPPLELLLADVAAAHPGLEIEVHEGGQAHPDLLLGAE